MVASSENKEVPRFAPCVEWPIVEAPVPPAKMKSAKTASNKPAGKVIEAEVPSAGVSNREISRPQASSRLRKWLASYAGAVVHWLAIDAGAFSVKAAIVAVGGTGIAVGGTGVVGYTPWGWVHPPRPAIESGWQPQVRVAPGNPNRR
jgi:hypothetical protein